MSTPADPGPILQLTERGARLRDTGRTARLADQFRRQHCVRLPQLVEPRLLGRIQRAIEHGDFRERAHGSVATELCMEADASVGLLHFLVNDPGVYRLIEVISGCLPVRCFSGRVYRHLPGQHQHSWHGDLSQDRQIGMSVNLSPDVYEGGTFEIRDVDTEQMFAAIANVGFGDAIIFRLAPTLEHRVTQVRGARPKTAFAGWFQPSPDYLATLRRDPYLADPT